MVLQLPQDLVHLERRQHRLDEHRRLDAALLHAERILRRLEDVVPQARLEMALHLGQVKIRPRAARQQFLGVVEEVQREVEDAARYRLAVDQDVLFVEVPAARARDEHRGLVVQRVALAALLEGDRAAHGVAQIDLPVDHVEPGRAVGVLEIRHEGGGARVERVDHHLAVGRPGDLDTAVEHVLGLRRDRPIRLTQRLGLGQEIGKFAGVEGLLPRGARGEQRLAMRLEPAG